MIVLEGEIGNRIFSKGTKYSYFGGNDYLGLASHPEVKEAVIKAVQKYGVNFSASRCTTGTSDIHLELEKQLSEFKGKQDTVVFASGYQGNGILMEILKGKYSTVLTDQYAHASIMAGVPREVSMITYNHCDADHLESLLEQNGIASPMIITDGIFALTGEIAPLDRIYPVVRKYNGILVVDDAHSTGILGKTGRGTPEHFNMPDNEDIHQTETMSKALGGYGGFISGSKILTELIRKRSATYQASTALPPPVVAAGIASLKIIRENQALRTGLVEKAAGMREEIAGLGFRTTGHGTPIIPLMFSSLERAENLCRFLGENKIIVPVIKYPSAQGLNIARVTVTASHTDNQIAELLRVLKKWIMKNGA